MAFFPKPRSEVGRSNVQIPVSPLTFTRKPHGAIEFDNPFMQAIGGMFQVGMRIGTTETDDID